MGQVLSAGVYNREIDLSLFVPAMSSTIFGCVGGAHKGETNKIIEVSSQNDYVKKLGKPTTPMGRAFFQYLRFGQKGLVVRVANGDAYAVASIKDSSDVETISVKSKTTGNSYNGIKINVLASVVGGSSKFKIVVEEEGFPVETWENLDKTTMESTINHETTGSEFIIVTNIPGNSNPPKVPQTVELLGGLSGDTSLSDNDYLGEKTGNTSTGLQCFANPEDVELDLIAIPGNSESAVITGLLDFVNTRGSGYALIDPPFGLSVDEVIDFYNGAGAWSGQHQALNSHRACLDWPWHRIFDSYTDKEEWMSPSGITAGVIAYNDYVSAPWYAAAGLSRGRVVNSLGIEYSPSLEERHRLNAFNKINPYVNFKSDGIVRWGADTLYRTSSALGNENVRRMLFFAEKQLSKVVSSVCFEPNDQKTWNELINLSNMVLDPIQADRGLYEYKVICDKTTTTNLLIDRNEVLVKILLKPTRYAKVIRLDWTLLRTSSKFEEFI